MRSLLIIATSVAIMLVFPLAIINCGSSNQRTEDESEQGQVVEAWVAQYDGLGNGTNANGNVAKDIAVDRYGNVYIAGYSSASYDDRPIETDYTTIKYRSDGNQFWVARYNGPGRYDYKNAGPQAACDYTTGTVTDDSGNVYITGWSAGESTSWDYATIKYDSDGNQDWVARYDGQAGSWDSAKALSLDKSGNVCVTGYSESHSTHSDYTTIKYDSYGDQLWISIYNGPANQADQSSAIITDSFFNVYVTGTINCSSVNLSDCDRNQRGDYATIKYDSKGNQLWVALYDGPVNGSDHAIDITMDSKGNIYVTGSSEGSNTGKDYTTVKYDSDGNQLWVVRYDGPASSSDTATTIAVDKWDNVFVTGSSEGIVTGQDFATIKYDTNGNQLWVARYNGPANGSDHTSATALDSSGNVYVTGFSEGKNSSGDFATIKYDTAGNQVWVARYNGPANGFDQAVDIAIDDSDNVYVTGNSYAESEMYKGPSNIVTIKYTQ